MKKVVFILASMLVIMLSGCGGGSASSATTSDSANVDNTNLGGGVSTTKDVKGLTQFPSVPALPES